MVRKYTPTPSFRKYIIQYQGTLNFANISIFYKKSAFFVKIPCFTKIKIKLEPKKYFKFCFHQMKDERLLFNIYSGF